jgi:repressor LexA
MSRRIPLTDRQAEVLSFIKSHIEERGYPPTIREIVARFEFSGTNAATCHLTALVHKGYLDRDPTVARGMRVL